MRVPLRHSSVLALKRLLYGRKGEPYYFQGRELRYVPGTRPVRPKYARSKLDVVARYDALQVELFSTELKEGDTAIDIGAHSGQYSLIMAAMCGRSGRVVSFEPDPHARRDLLRNIALNPQVKRPIVEEAAVSDGDGEAWLYSRGDATSSLARLCAGASADSRNEKIRVKIVSLDAYLAAQGIAEPRWIKIDTEGAEIRILSGAKAVLSGHSNILCELHPYAWPDFGNTFDELQALCNVAGRRVRYLDETSELQGKPRYGAVLLERCVQRHGV